MEEETTIKLVTKDGKEIEITKKQAELSDILKGAINDFPKDGTFPLNEIGEKDAEKIKEFLAHYNGVPPPEIEKPLISNEMKNLTDEWAANFIDKMPIEDLVNLSIAANYLSINSLLDLCCAKMASLCKDKNEDEIYKAFNITEPFTEEEKNKIKEENKWLDENL